MIIHFHTAKKVASLCGFGSVAMIDYLERSKVFIPTKGRQKIRGKPREYCFRDVMVLKMISALLANGASVSNLKKAFRDLQQLKWIADEVTLEDSKGPLRHLIVSGGKIYLARSKDELVDLANGGQLSFSFLLDLDKLHRDLARDWRQSDLKLTG